ncbi:hypothetical protein Cgig2_027299 [Carnegiea gigantea]|uniref:Uncharacterized protein n=1 Tax=Carnegiea gigantea TaxID=171969 RepID=A0A9Q1GHM8_9CARY|nr:hypothetical protein Cgig2_027299 [Carnegiea gigantea]
MQSRASLKVQKKHYSRKLRENKETDDTIEDITYKMPPHWHKDESDSEGEVLVKRIKKIKQASKPRSKQIQMSVLGHKLKREAGYPGKSKKSCKAWTTLSFAICLTKEIPEIAKAGTKPKKIFQTRMSSSWFVALIENFNKAHRQAIHDVGFGGFLHLQVTELLGDLCKWLVDSFDPYLVTLYITADKKIEITPIDVHLRIGGRKVEEF